MRDATRWATLLDAPARGLAPGPAESRAQPGSGQGSVKTVGPRLDGDASGTLPPRRTSALERDAALSLSAHEMASGSVRANRTRAAGVGGVKAEAAKKGN